MDMTLRFKLPARTRADQRGFTLIEVLVVLVLLGLILGLVAPRALDFLGRGQSQAAKLQITSLGTNLDLFRLDVGRYPTQDEGLAALIARPAGLQRWNGPYLDGTAVPQDPWGHSYQYRTPGGEGRRYDLLSLGADGREGGEGQDADIGNW
jgi:general secretion pathway protein G